MKSTSNRSPGGPEPTLGAKPRALVVRIGALGDVLLSRRLCYSLSLAGYRSTLMAPRRHASLLLADPWIEAILDSESSGFAAAFAGLWPHEGAAFDIALSISNSNDLAEAARLAAARVIRISPGPERDDASISQQWADAAHAFCAPFTGVLPLLEATAPETVASGATLIHPGSGSPRKNWPIERFVELDRRLVALGHRVAWIRGPAEADPPEEISLDRVIDRPSLQTLASCLGESRLYVGNDSGVSHLAGAVGAPAVVLFGPTRASVWRPDGPRVQVVPSRSEALSDIPVEAVIDAANRCG